MGFSNLVKAPLRLDPPRVANYPKFVRWKMKRFLRSPFPTDKQKTYLKKLIGLNVVDMM